MKMNPIIVFTDNTWTYSDWEKKLNPMKIIKSFKKQPEKPVEEVFGNMADNLPFVIPLSVNRQEEKAIRKIITEALEPIDKVEVQFLNALFDPDDERSYKEIFDFYHDKFIRIMKSKRNQGYFDLIQPNELYFIQCYGRFENEDSAGIESLRTLSERLRLIMDRFDENYCCQKLYDEITKKQG